MNTERGNSSNLRLSPDTTGRLLISKLLAALEEDKSRREEQIEQKVRQALTQAFEVLITRAKSAVPDHPESIDEIAIFLNADKVLKSALTSGSIGRARVEEVFTRARFYIEDYLTNPRWENASPESKMAIKNLGEYLKVAANNIVTELDDVRSLKAGLAQQNSRVKQVLETIRDSKHAHQLHARVIPDSDALALWVVEVSKFFRDTNDTKKELAKSFRPAYIKAWQDFIEVHFPLIGQSKSDERVSQPTGNRFEARLNELLQQKLLQTSLDEFQKLVLTSDKLRNTLQQAKMESSNLAKAQQVIPVEMVSSATKVEIILRIPENQIRNLNRIQNEAFLDLNDIIGEHEARIRIDSKNAGRMQFLVISTRDVKDRRWIADLQELASKIARQFRH